MFEARIVLYVKVIRFIAERPYTIQLFLMKDLFGRKKRNAEGQKEESDKESKDQLTKFTSLNFGGAKQQIV